MFKIENKNIHCTRGDVGLIKFNAVKKDGTPHTFSVGDVITFAVVPKKGYTGGPLLKKEILVESAKQVIDIDLTSRDTKIGNMINKKVTYWYNIVLNNNQTLLGSDLDGEKKFILYPEVGEES